MDSDVIEDSIEEISLAIIKDINCGSNIKEMAESCGISEQLIERNCHQYLMHLGVDVVWGRWGYSAGRSKIILQ